MSSNICYRVTLTQEGGKQDLARVVNSVAANLAAVGGTIDRIIMDAPGEYSEIAAAASELLHLQNLILQEVGQSLQKNGKAAEVGA
ncbi:hypothetical protein [Stenotrophomonas sp. UBA7606]|uniref:hypothetical protein n=1 Tax=Stenotrophomonas sp. UBA7606 TaxID=1947559 RepID=UPI0025D64C21|nr:hypothetical protein [Stenotrophomonas sp. UBA7606]